MRDDFVHFCSPDPMQKKLLIYSDGMGFEQNPNFYIDRPSFYNFIIMYTMRGILCCEQEGRRVTVSQGEAVLLDARHPHRYYFEKEHHTQIAWCHVNGEPAVSLVDYLAAHSPLPLKLQNAHIYERLLALFEISDHPTPDPFAQSEACYGLLMEFLQTVYQTENAPLLPSHLEKFKRKIWHYILHHLGEEIALESLAAYMSVSKYHFARTFRRIFGMSVMQFITKERLQQAKYRLQNTNQSICEIAEDLGFSNGGYFTKVFKKAYGITPTHYRRDPKKPTEK